jgi:adenylate cyclase
MLRLRGLIEDEERVFPIAGEEVRLGRGSDNQLVLPDFSVSRKHATLRFEEGAWFLYDLESTNGVQVNGVGVQSAPLSAGDRLKVGIFEFVVESDELIPEIAGARSPIVAERSSSISSATIVRRLEDFSADYGLVGTGAVPMVAPDAEAHRKALEDQYSNSIFSILTRLARMLIQTNSADEVLEKVFAIAFEALRVDRGFILLRDEVTGELNCELSRVGDEVTLRPEGEVPVSHTMLEEVMRERVALLTYDAQADQRLVTGESIRIHQIRAAMCVPLWSGDNIIGVMQVDSPFHAGSFTEGDLDLFAALANYAAVAVERIRYAEKVEYERAVRSQLERYHSPAVIDLVLQQDTRPGEVSTRTLKPTVATVLFADVVGFTPLSERLPVEEIATMLEGFFTHSVDAIFSQGGTLDKFIGDCVMAFFGAPVPQSDHAMRAVRAAVQLQRAIAEWNEERAARGADPILSRVGINSGPVVVGDVGSNRRVDYTVLGNTVNVAARLESGAAGPAEIVIGADTFAQLDGSIATESLGEFQLKGLAKKVAAHRVLWRQ